MSSLLATEIHAKDLLVYAGPGAGEQSVANSVLMLKSMASAEYNIKTILPEEVINTNWEENTDLFLMPGGADLPYVAELSGPGNIKIRNYVANGGKYLGICAGAYYAADRIEFAKGDPKLEVTGERELKFFPGLVSGPTLPGYDHRNPSTYAGAYAAPISWGGGLPVFYFGGGHFVDADKINDITILARYLISEEPAAVVIRNIGKGKVLLSGIHFERDPNTLEDIPKLQAIKKELIAVEPARKVMVREFLEALDLKTTYT